MINILNFKHNKEMEVYSKREDLYKRISTLEELYNEYVILEPHTFLHAGAISKTISKKQLNGMSAISIGMDLIKDSTLVKNNNYSIDVFDIDEKAVSLANKFSNGLLISDSLKYFKQDVLSKDFKIKNKYEILILSQMDYIFSDDQIKFLLKKISKSHIKYILIITPSIFSFSFSPYKFVDLIYNFLRCLKSYLKANKNNYYTTYRRRKTHLLNLFKQYYYCDYQFDYAYPSGREYLFLLKSKIL